MNDTTREAVERLGGMSWDAAYGVLTAHRASLYAEGAKRNAEVIALNTVLHYVPRLREALQDAEDRANAFATKEMHNERRAETAEAALSDARAERDAAVAAAAYEAAIKDIRLSGDPAVTQALGQQICCSGFDCGCYGSTVGDFLEHTIRALTLADATDALAAMLAEAREQGRREAVKVKPLVWEDMGHYERAKTDFGDYEAGWDDGVWAVCDGPISWEWSIGEDHRGLTVYAAKAAAQADFERRIRAALSGEDE